MFYVWVDRFCLGSLTQTSLQTENDKKIREYAMQLRDFGIKKGIASAKGIDVFSVLMRRLEPCQGGVQLES